ncbi:hypothetical protein DJ535_04605 [Citrobacter murliniae]|uniref:Uncharacterized protein n=1 Tax=Citrobacter murliniae TaxID=67829 RepID=A0ABY2PY79_9ENTR|nr:hypothetical protein DJ535_04605 [Citrobacter murliniae]
MISALCSGKYTLFNMLNRNKAIKCDPVLNLNSRIIVPTFGECEWMPNTKLRCQGMVACERLKERSAGCTIHKKLFLQGRYL